MDNNPNSNNVITYTNDPSYIPLHGAPIIYTIYNDPDLKEYFPKSESVTLYKGVIQP